LLDEGHLRVVAARGFAEIDKVIGSEFASDDQLFQEIRRAGRSVILEDAQVDRRFHRWLGTSYVRGWMGVPLVLRGEVIGYITLDHHLPGAYAQDDAALAEAFANQAAVAIENARLYKIAQDRAAGLEAVRQASLSLTASLDLPHVLDEILEAVLSLLPQVYNSHIFLYNPETSELTFGASLWADGRRGYPIAIPRPHGLTNTVARRGEMIVVPDMRSHPLFQDAPADWNGAIVGLPLKIGQRVVGVMNVSYTRPRTFPEAELQILRLLADQAAVAIENARLYAQVATEKRHLSLLYEIGRVLTTSLDPEEILERAITLICQSLDGLVGQVFLYDPAEDRLRLRALYGRPEVPLEELDQRYILRPGQGLAGWVAQTRQAANVADVTQDGRWLHIPIVDDGVSAAISAPILGDEHLLGVISVLHNQAGAFTSDHLTLLQAICQEVGLALSNAARYQEAQRRLAEMTLIQNLAQTFNQRLELQELLNEVVTQLGERLGYPHVEIFLIEGEALFQRAAYGVPLIRDSLPLDKGIVGRVARTGQAALVLDIARDPDYIPYLPDTVAELAVPIFHGQAVVGVINIETQQLNQLTVQDKSLLEVLAGQISIAVENAVLFERVRHHAENLEHIVARRTAELVELYELSQKIGYTLSYEELLRLLLGHLRKAIRSDLVVGGFFLEGYRLLYVETSKPLTATAFRDLRSYWLNVLKRHGLYSAEFENVPIEATSAEAFQVSESPLTQVKSLISAPITVDGSMVGMLIAGSQSRNAFGDVQERLLETFANQASAAIQRLRAIRAAEQKRLEGLVEHLPIGVLLLDENYHLLVANPQGKALLSDLNVGLAEGRLLRLGDRDIEDLIAHHQDMVPLEIILEGPPRRIFEVQARPVGEENPQWLLTVREITQEREVQSRIQMQERLATVGQLAAGIAHDFNNIMAAIMVYTDLIAEDPDLPPLTRERLLTIQQQVNRASSLIRQILDFSRRSVMEQSALDLLPFLKELDKMLGRVMPETVQIELSYQAGSYLVQADPARLQQALMNLALNARDAMPQGGLLQFEMSRFHLEPGEKPPVAEMPPGDWIRIRVSDTGVGIAPEHMSHLFEPFFTTKPVGQGTGLGLAQVYGIIKQHDGFIDVQSRVGKGTTFTIYLPALNLPAKDEARLEATPRVDGVGKTVMVVEDDVATREALQALLEAYHYKVLTAANGSEAIKRLEGMEGQIDLVISDVVMPLMGGVALYRTLGERWPGVKMLFVTGHPLEGENQELLERGDVHWLQKPFSVQSFTQTIQMILEGE
jgi:GAF domain-containing protein